MTFYFFSQNTLINLIIWLFVGSGIIEFSPIKINPWSYVGNKIIKALNGEVIAKIQGLEEKVGKIQNNLDEDRAINARVRILRFNDEILQSVRHTKESFDQCLSDIDNYENYCEIHKSFKNNRTVMAVTNIKETYNKCMKEKDFL